MAKRRGKQRRKESGAVIEATGLGTVLPITGHPQFAKFATVGLFVLACLLYLNTIGNEFTNWDDPVLILENRAILSLSSENVKEIFTPVKGVTYQPVRVLSYAIDYHLWKFKPAGYHVVNFVLHAIGSGALFLLLLMFLNEARGGSEKDNRMIALCTAALFAAHPVNVEAVTWLASRKYGLLSAFAFSGMAMHVYGTRRQLTKIAFPWVISGAVLMVLAMLSSPFGIVLAPLLLLMDLARIRKRDEIRNYALAYIPLALLSIFPYYAIALGLLSEGSAAAHRFHYKGDPRYTYTTVLRALFDYAVNYVYPVNLCNKYPNAIVDRPSDMSDTKTLRALAATIGVLASAVCAGFALRKQHRLFPFCFAWAFVAWFPVSNIKVPISTTMADRYLYLPGIGVFLAVCLGLNWLAGRVNARALLGAFCVIMLIFGGLTMRRNTHWRSSITLWESALKAHPKNPVGLNNYGDALRERGKAEAAARIQRAQKHAVELRTTNPKAANEHLQAEQKAAQEEETRIRAEAAKQYQASLDLFEPHAEAHKNLGTYHLRVKNYEKAIHHLGRAVEIRAEKGQFFPAALSNLGVCYIQNENPAEAAKCFEIAVKNDPYLMDYRINLALAYLQMGGRVAAAVTQFKETMRLAGNDKQALAIGNRLREKKHFAEAIEYYQLAVQATPSPNEEQTARFSNAQCLLALGRLAEAKVEMDRAYTIQPNEHAQKFHFSLLRAYETAMKRKQVLQ